MNKKIIIVRPYGYFGGTLVLDLLCKLLREKGIDARLFYFPMDAINAKHFWKEWIKNVTRYLTYRFYYSQLKHSSSLRASCYRKLYEETMPGLKPQVFPFFSKRNTIVLYPEVISGNFLKAKNVVRWFLYYNRFANKPEAYGKDDFFICFRELFNDWNLNPQGLEVTLSYFDNKIYRQYNFGQRKGNCYILRKGKSRSDLPLTFDGPVIDFGMDEEDIVRILNTCKYCYSYDMQTFYTTIAAVCGCIPINVLEPGKTIEDYMGNDEIAQRAGIAFGDSPEEIQFAESTRSQLLQRLDYSKSNEENINKFIQYVSERFG